jgi:pimeloyl-ACP methyl ester carboxylesterase
MAILNGPHPATLPRHIRSHPTQALRLFYFVGFQVPALPEAMLRAGNFAALARSMRATARRGSFTEGDMARSRAAWAQPGALTAMLNWYRAAMRQSPRDLERRMKPVPAPTLVIWGEQDRYLSKELAEPHRSDVPNLERVVRLPNASHWVQHDEPETVSRLLGEFFGEVALAPAQARVPPAR